MKIILTCAWIVIAVLIAMLCWMAVAVVAEIILSV
jgi:hypothetical protein